MALGPLLSPPRACTCNLRVYDLVLWRIRPLAATAPGRPLQHPPVKLPSDSMFPSPGPWQVSVCPVYLPAAQLSHLRRGLFGLTRCFVPWLMCRTFETPTS